MEKLEETLTQLEHAVEYGKSYRAELDRIHKRQEEEAEARKEKKRKIMVGNAKSDEEKAFKEWLDRVRFATTPEENKEYKDYVYDLDEAGNVIPELYFWRKYARSVWKQRLEEDEKEEEEKSV